MALRGRRALGSEPFIHAYEPFSQFPDGMLNNVPSAFRRHVNLAVRTNADPRALVASVRGEIASIDQQFAIEAIETKEDRLGESVAPRRFMVVGQGLTQVAIGLVAGALMSFWVARALTSLLYETEAHDAVTFASVPVVLALISLAACALPALRASRVEPISSLRGKWSSI